MHPEAYGRKKEKVICSSAGNEEKISAYTYSHHASLYREILLNDPWHFPAMDSRRHAVFDPIFHCSWLS